MSGICNATRKLAIAIGRASASHKRQERNTSFI